VVQLRNPGDVDAAAALAAFVHTRGATDVLLDASGGRGQAIDVAAAEVAVQQIRDACPGLGIGIAGGLCAEMVPQVAHLLADGVSVDAEGALRDEAEGGGDLVPEAVAEYLAAVGKAVSR
jgi:hypothetical protein